MQPHNIGLLLLAIALIVLFVARVGYLSYKLNKSENKIMPITKHWGIVRVTKENWQDLENQNRVSTETRPHIVPLTDAAKQLISSVVFPVEITTHLVPSKLKYEPKVGLSYFANAGYNHLVGEINYIEKLMGTLGLI